MKHKSSYYTILLLAAIIGCVLRFWNLTAGIDAQGLPYSGHISASLMAGWWVLCALLFAVISKPRSGLSSDHSVLYCGGSGALLGYLGAGFILISALLRFVDALTAGPTMSAPIMLLLGLLAGICLMIAAYMRSHSRPTAPPLELLPELYLVIQLILNFKHWSTDPIILDYCVLLFAMIFVVLAFYYGTGFLFDSGKPRLTLFFSLCAVFFSVSAVLDGAMDHNAATATAYLGFILWLLPTMGSIISAPAVPGQSE